MPLKVSEMLRRRGQQQLTQTIFTPPMQGGINAVSAAGNIPPGDALYLYNMIPNDYGVRVRNGAREHCNPIPNGNAVRTIIPFNTMQAAAAPNDKLFVATQDGIYDCTTPGSTPVRVLQWPNPIDPAGYVSWHAYTTVAGQYILVCDLVNGYYIYSATTGSWTQGSITGPDEAIMDFVTVWKNRVWFIERNSGNAWYLPVGQISGNATKFEFGNKFKYGGWLKSLWNWSLDAGEGLDDYLVAISSAGDMVVYKGSDPAQASTFNMVGWWYIGRVTQGRRQANDMGGELLVLSTYGLLQLSKVIAGLPVTDEGASVSYKINTRLNATMERTYQDFGWDVKMYPRGQLIFVTTPKEVGRPWMQYVYSLTTRAWAQFFDLNMVCCEAWRGDFYFGTEVGRIMQYTGFSDNVLIADNGDSAKAIDWEMLSGYQMYTDAPEFKRVHFLRPQFVGTAKPIYSIKASYDFDLQRIAGSPPYVDPKTGLWNTGIWENAYWGGSYIVDQPPKGAAGMGRHIAIAMKGRSAVETIHVGTDVLLDKGGML